VVSGFSRTFLTSPIALVTESLDPTFGLDDEAVKAAWQWSFKPATKDGKPVAVGVELELRFVLK
jgi:hypothetical protein